MSDRLLLAAMDETRFVRRAPTRPVVWLGEKESASFVVPIGARFPATATKEKDFVLDLRSREHS